MITGAVVVGCGDIIAQKLSPTRSPLDYQRILSMSLYGFLISGGIGHVWFRLLDKTFGTGMSLKSSIQKVLADQFIIAPPEIAFFLAWSHYSGEHTQSLKDLLVTTMPSLLAQNYMIWLPSQFINFYFIPEQHRVLFMCFICVFWFAILSYTSHEYENNSNNQIS
jgi:hypothetical protein